MSDNLYCAVTGISNIISAGVDASHSSSIATATIETATPTVDIGDPIEVYMGYTDNYAKVFQGYVKKITYSVPDRVYTITAYDDLIRASDYFIVPTNPANSLKYRNKVAEDLVEELLALASLTNVTHQDTSFTFGVVNEFEVIQVSVLDYCKTIGDYLTWHLWCDRTGLIHFENRKPFVMYGDSGLYGDKVDTVIAGFTWDDEHVLSISKDVDENDLRNRVVVYGTNNIYAEAKDDDTPYFKWKTAVLADSQLVQSTAIAQAIADKNLYLLNKITEGISVTMRGDPLLQARGVIEVNSTLADVSATKYYILSCNHRISNSGYTTKLELRK